MAAWHGWDDIVALLLPFSDPDNALLGPTPLRLATNEAHTAVIERLGPHVDPNLADTDGITPLMAAAGDPRPESLPAVMALPGLDLDRTDRLGATALMHAVRALRFDKAERLIRAGANPNVQDTENGMTALMMALANEAHDLIDLWLRYDGRADLQPHQRLNLQLRNAQGQTVDAFAQALNAPHQDVLRQRRILQEATLLRTAMAGETVPVSPSASAHGESRPRPRL